MGFNLATAQPEKKSGFDLSTAQSETDPVSDPVSDITDEMSTGQRVAVGIGRGIMSTGQGVKQLGMEVGETLGFVSPDSIDTYRQEIGLEKDLYDRGVGQTTAGTVGEVIGVGAATAPAMLVPGGAAANLSTRVASGAGAGAIAAGTQPVYGEDFASEKATQVGSGALLGAGATYGLDKLSKIMPKNLMKRFYQKSQEGFTKKGKIQKTQLIEEADVLEGVTGIKMTPAEKAASKPLQMLENLSRQSIITAGRVAEYDESVARNAVASVHKLARQVSRPRKGAETVGNELQQAAKKAVTDQIKLRQSQAKNDYGMADEISGGAKVVEQNNYINELKNIIDEFGGRTSPEAKSIVNQAKKMLKGSTETVTRKKMSLTGGLEDDVTETLIKKSVNDAVSDRSYYGRAAQGTGNIFKDIEYNQNRMLASRIHKAMTKDLIDSESMGDVGVALRQANDNYAANSATIDAIQNAPLAKILGKEFDDVTDAIGAGSFNTISGEKAAKKIMSLDPSEIKQTMRAIEKVNPDTAASLRAFVIRDALEKSYHAPSAGIDKGLLSFNKFQTNMKKSNFASYGFKPEDKKQIDNILKAMERIGDKSGYNFSGTQVQGNIMELSRNLSGALTGSISKASALAMETIGLRRIASAMTTKEGRDALQTITHHSQGADKIEKALRVIERLTIADSAALKAQDETPVNEILINRGQ